MVSILVPIAHGFTFFHSLGERTREIKKLVHLPYMGEGGVLIPFVGQCCDPLECVKL